MDTNLTPQTMTHEEKIVQAQALMKELPQVFIPAQVFEGHGMVTRVIFIPAGTVLVGKKHLQGQHNFLMQGRIELATEHGPEIHDAPEVIVSPPGTKRAAVAITDVVWATTLATDLAPDDIEQQLIAPEDRAPALETQS